jgi:HK97 family phage major capsid protein
MKELLEKRNTMLDELDSILNKAKEEKRAFDDAELKKVADLKEEIRKIDESIKLEEEVRGMTKVEIKKPETRSAEEIRAEVVAKEERAFVEYIKGIDTRALSASGQGVVIPQTIANRIIDTVKNMSPILAKAKFGMYQGI